MQLGGLLQCWRRLLHRAHSLSQLASGRQSISPAPVHQMRCSSMLSPRGMYLAAAGPRCMQAGCTHVSG